MIAVRFNALVQRPFHRTNAAILFDKVKNGKRQATHLWLPEHNIGKIDYMQRAALAS